MIVLELHKEYPARKVGDRLLVRVPKETARQEVIPPAGWTAEEAYHDCVWFSHIVMLGDPDVVSFHRTNAGDPVGLTADEYDSVKTAAEAVLHIAAAHYAAVLNRDYESALNFMCTLGQCAEQGKQGYQDLMDVVEEENGNSQ